jgi:hypothetical protein
VKELLGSEMKPLGKNDILREGVEVTMILFVTRNLLGSVLVLESAFDVCMENCVFAVVGGNENGSKETLTCFIYLMV